MAATAPLHIIFHYALGVQRAALSIICLFPHPATRVRIVRTRPRELPFGSLTQLNSTHSLRALIAHSHRSYLGECKSHSGEFSLCAARRFIVWLMYASASALVRSGLSRYQPGELSAEADCGDRFSLTFGLAALTSCDRSMSVCCLPNEYRAWIFHGIRITL